MKRPQMEGYDDQKTSYYEALARKTEYQAEMERLKLEKMRGNLVDMDVVRRLEGLVISFMRDLQKNYGDDKNLMDRIEDFSDSWNRCFE